MVGKVMLKATRATFHVSANWQGMISRCGHPFTKRRLQNIGEVGAERAQSWNPEILLLQPGDKRMRSSFKAQRCEDAATDAPDLGSQQM